MTIEELKEKKRKESPDKSIEYAKQMVKFIDEHPHCVIEVNGFKFPGHLAKAAYKRYIKINSNQN